MLMSYARTAATMTAFALVLAACGRDAQTDQDVTTEGPDGMMSSSVSGDSADKAGVAMVRVVNAAAGSQDLVVRTDETHALPSVQYKQVTPYQMIDRTWVTFQVRGTPTTAYEPLETNREMLTDGHRYSMVLMRDEQGGAIRTRVLRDELPSDTAMAHVRVIHAAAGIGEVNVVARGGETLFDGVNFTSEAGFKGVMPWTGTIEIRAEDGNRLLLSVPDVKLERGTAATIVLARDANGKVEAFSFMDSPTSAPM